MNCSKCQAQNEESAQFCRYCGTNLHANVEPKREGELRDALLIIFIIIGFISCLAEFVIQRLDANWYDGPTKYIQGAFWIFSNLSFIIIPFAIKNKSLKIVGFIITVLFVIYWTYTNVDFLLT